MEQKGEVKHALACIQCILNLCNTLILKHRRIKQGFLLLEPTTEKVLDKLALPFSNSTFQRFDSMTSFLAPDLCFLDFAREILQGYSHMKRTAVLTVSFRG